MGRALRLNELRRLPESGGLRTHLKLGEVQPPDGVSIWDPALHVEEDRFITTYEDADGTLFVKVYRLATDG